MEDKNRILKGDNYIWGVFFMLCIISIVEMYSASSTLTFKIQDYFAPTIRHTLILMVGALTTIFVHNIHYKYFKALPILLLPLSIAMLVWLLFFGETINGAQRWISLFGIPLQPSELAKLGLVTAVAYILGRNQTEKGVTPPTFKYIMGLMLIVCGFILPENFSTAFLLGTVCFAMMFIGRVEWTKLAGTIGVAFALVAILFVVAPQFPDNELFGRVTTWENRILNFSSDTPAYMEKTNDKNFQVHHARMALSNGGITGTMPGNSRERDFLPQAYSDFIYAIIFEEMGFLGGLTVMILYLSILVRAGIIARRCRHAFPAFLIMGIAMGIVFQALINMAVAVGLMPVTGQPLPLISRGGTSTIITCINFGIMLSISRYALESDEEKEQEQEEGEDKKDTSILLPAEDAVNAAIDEENNVVDILRHMESTGIEKFKP